jgi:transposase InsO family protein
VFKPIENAYVERCNGKCRDECLNEHWFLSIAEAQQIIEAWRVDYNAVRPHRSLGQLTPAAMGAMWVDSREPRESTAINEIGIQLETTVCSVTFPL